MSIVLTGASGQLGGSVLKHLLKKVPANQLILAVRDPEKAKAFAEIGFKVRHGDYNDASSLEGAFAGASKLLLISSPDEDNELRIGQHATAVEAARKAGVGHIVYTSFAYAEQSSLPLAEVHLTTEAVIRESGIPYTFLRNSLYHDLFVNPGLQAAVESGLLFSTGQGKLNTATRHDLALAAATVLAEAGHENKSYELTAPQLWSYEDLAKTLTEVTGKPVAHHVISAEDMQAGLIKAGVPAGVAEMMTAIQTLIAAGELEQVSNDLKSLIGDSATTLKASVEQIFNR